MAYQNIKLGKSGVQLEITTFGGLSILRNGALLTDLASRKAEALLVYLASSGNPHPRESLADLLWDDRSQERALGNLRVILSSLRKELGEFIDITRQTVSVPSHANLWLDISEMESSLHGIMELSRVNSPGMAAQIEQAIDLYKGEFLEGFFVRQASRFEDWVVRERERIHQGISKALFALVEYHLRQGAYEAGLAHARRLVQLEPLSEKALQLLMRLLAYSGQRAAALEQYENFQETLKAELGITPSEETSVLVEKIRAGDSHALDAAHQPMVPAVPKHNLPAQLTPFIGRDRELIEVTAQLQKSKHRIVTLSGPGGVGKTRLAVRCAESLIDHYQDGIFFVDLASISEPELIPGRIAGVCGIKEAPGSSLIEDIKELFKTKHALLVLDNFEQLIAGAQFVAEIIAAAPNLDILITSRQKLRIYGENEYPVPPLELPDLEHDEPTTQISQYESVALFTQRAQASDPSFSLKKDNALAVAQICVRLDGLPLAIELAAARVKVYSPHYLLSLLNNTLETLTVGPRDVATRHQTLRAAIEWSYDLLNDEEKKLFTRLAVFQGYRSLEAIETVCGQDLKRDVMEVLESLQNQSLIQLVPDLAGEPRFVLLETIRQFASQQLEQRGESEDLHARHADYFLKLAERAEPELRGPTQEEWSTHLRVEYDNLRAALAWALQNKDAHIGLRLAGSLSEFWYYEGPISEGELWMNRALERIAEVPAEIRARVLNGAGMLAFARGEHQQGKEWNKAALEIAKEIQNRSIWAWSLFWLSAHATTDPNEYKEGIAYCEQALKLFHEIDEKPGLAWAYNQLGESSRMIEDHDRAREAYKKSIEICRITGNKRREGIALINLSYVHQHQGDYRNAERVAKEGLQVLSDLALEYHSAIALSILAGPLSAQGKARQAATLLGASEGIFERLSVSLQPADRIEIDAYVSRVHELLGKEEAEKAWAEGRSMSLKQALSFALK